MDVILKIYNLIIKCFTNIIYHSILIHLLHYYIIFKQTEEALHRCSFKNLKICNKFTGEHPCVIEITVWHGCSPVDFLHIFWTPFPKNTSGGLLVNKRMARLVTFVFYMLYVLFYSHALVCNIVMKNHNNTE